VCVFHLHRNHAIRGVVSIFISPSDSRTPWPPPPAPRPSARLTKPTRSAAPPPRPPPPKDVRALPAVRALRGEAAAAASADSASAGGGDQRGGDEGGGEDLGGPFRALCLPDGQGLSRVDLRGSDTADAPCLLGDRGVE
jgi:hypothetical protein